MHLKKRKLKRVIGGDQAANNNADWGDFQSSNGTGEFNPFSGQGGDFGNQGTTFFHLIHIFCLKWILSCLVFTFSPRSRGFPQEGGSMGEEQEALQS